MDPTLVGGSREDAHNLDDLKFRAEENSAAKAEAQERPKTTREMRRHWRIQREKQQERIH